MTAAENHGKDEMTLIDIWNFIKRQCKTILIVFALLSLATVIFAYSRPNLYVSTMDIEVGERFFVLQSQFAGNYSIEPPEQIKYKYGDRVSIVPIKSTRIVKVSSKSGDLEKSKKDVTDVVSQIIQSHKEMLDEKRTEFKKLLEVTQINNKKEIFELLNVVSASSNTKQIGSLETEILLYGGTLTKTIRNGVLAALFMSFSIAFLMERMSRYLKK